MTQRRTRALPIADLLHLSGCIIRPPGLVKAEVQLAQEGRVLVMKNEAEFQWVRGVIETAGLIYTTNGKTIHIADEAAQRASQLILQFSMPVKLPTLNPMLRSNWVERRKILQALSWEVKVAIPHKAKPSRPLENIEIEIDRYNSNEPDQENLTASSKLLLDVMQPFHPDKRPYGLDVIREDAKWCVHDVDVRHVPSRQLRTDVRIYASRYTKNGHPS